MKLKAFIQLIFFTTDQAISDVDITQVFMENVYWLGLALILCFPIYRWFQDVVRMYVASHFIRNALGVSLTFLFFFSSVIMLVGNSYNPFIYFRF